MRKLIKNNQELAKQIQIELNHAEKARAKGNEGMARVCARRAAGIAIGEYLFRKGCQDIGTSAYEHLMTLKTLPDISTEAYEIAGHMVLHVNEYHQLPVDIDLIEEARWLIQYLLREIEI